MQKGSELKVIKSVDINEPNKQPQETDTGGWLSLTKSKHVIRNQLLVGEKNNDYNFKLQHYARLNVGGDTEITVDNGCRLRVQKDGKLSNRGKLVLKGAELISPLIDTKNDFKKTRRGKDKLKHGIDNEGGIITVGKDFSEIFKEKGDYPPEDNFIMDLEGVKIKLFNPCNPNVSNDVLNNLDTFKNIEIGDGCILDGKFEFDSDELRISGSTKSSKNTTVKEKCKNNKTKKKKSKSNLSIDALRKMFESGNENILREMFKNGNELKINPEYFAGEETNMDRVKYNTNDLLNDIPNIQNGIGEDLTYTDIYDNIKKARFEEDNVLSQGVWKHELKVPDWKLVEKLSVEAIQNKSKDLQIIGWLIESLVMLDKFEGISNSISILNSFINKYWETCYPLLEDKTSNIDQKLRILEWIYETVYRRSNLINLFGNNSFSIYNYEYALEINSNIIKNPNNKYQILESAKKNNIKFLEDINNIINNIDQNEVDKLNNNINNIKNNITELKNTLKEKINNDRAFTKLLNNIDKIGKLLSRRKSNNIINNENKEDKNNTNIIDNRMKENTDNKVNHIESNTNIIDNRTQENINNNTSSEGNNTNVIYNKQENKNDIEIDYDSESYVIEGSVMYNKKQKNENNIKPANNKENKNINDNINLNENNINIIDNKKQKSTSDNIILDKKSNLINNKKEKNKDNTKLINNEEQGNISNNTDLNGNNNNTNKNSNNEINIKNEKQDMLNNNKISTNNINKSLSREEIYNSLSELYLQLKEVDKHSPSPYLLNLVLEWKDKTLLEIITDAKTGNTESHQLLRKLIS